MAVLLVSMANAQTPSSPVAAGARQEYEAAFRAMLANPRDLELTFRYAELAVAIGDLEGAIGAYESLLLFNPDLPHVQLALGELYLKLDSQAAARAYLEAARDSPVAPPETRRRVATILASLDAGGTAPRQFSGYLQLGGSWQSNASNGAAATRIRSFGVSVEVPRNARKINDYGATLSGEFDHYVNLGDAAEPVLESYARFYLTRQLKASNVNLSVAQLDSGPRITFGGKFEGVSLRPYLTAGLIGLRDRLFQWSGGGGVGLSALFGDKWSVDADLSERGQFYNNSTALPTATDANGATFDGSALVSFNPTFSDTLRAGPAVEILDARTAGQRYWQYGAQAAWQHRFADPTGWSGQSWSATIEGNRLWRNYAGPDPTVDPVVTRSDREWNLDAALTIPINNAWLLVADVSQQSVTSNLSNFRFDNTTISLSVGIRF